MSPRKGQRKRREDQQKKKSNTPSSFPSELPSSTVKTENGIVLKKKSIWKATWKIIVFFGTVISFFYLKDPIKKTFQTQHESFVEQNYITGILIPGQLNADREITFRIGGNTVVIPIGALQRGSAFKPLNISMGENEEVPWNMKLKLINNRLYAYTELRYFGDHSLIGTIEYDKWKLRTGNISDFGSTDQFLEVKDVEGNVVFSMNMSEPNTIEFKGYYLTQDYTVVIDTMMNINMKENLQAVRDNASKIPWIEIKD